MPVGNVIFSVFAMALGVGALAIVTEHFQKIAQIKAKGRGSTDEATQRALEDLRRDLTALRETATQYDVSFDTALQRIEQNVAQMERRLATVEQDQARVGRG